MQNFLGNKSMVEALLSRVRHYCHTGNHQRAVAARSAGLRHVVEQRRVCSAASRSLFARRREFRRGATAEPFVRAQLHNRECRWKRRERVHTCGSAVRSVRRPMRPGSGSFDPWHYFCAGDRGSPALKVGQEYFQHLRSNSADHCRTISPSLSKRQPTTRPAAGDIDPTHISQNNAHACAWMMTCVQTIILFPHRVTLAEHSGSLFPSADATWLNNMGDDD